MPLRRTAALSTTALLIGALVWGGAATAASALGEPDGLYSASNDEDLGGGGQFVQLDKTDATATPLGSVVDEYEFYSVEVVNGVGYATGVILGEGDDEDVYAVFTWNIVTGVVLTVVPLTAAAEITGIWALDTRMDGVLIAYVAFVDDDDEDDNDERWISSINPVSGLVTPLVDLDLVEDDRIFEGLATNPVDGITYALADYDDGLPAASPVNFVAGTIGASVIYEEIADNIGDGWFSEGDFDETGVLWFTYSSAGVSRTNAPLDVAVEATELGTPEIASKAITIGQVIVIEPELAATGVSAGPIGVVAVALLSIGGVLMIARRRAVTLEVQS